MYEIHANEQYFFDQPTLDRLCDLLIGFDRVCVLCAPRLGGALEQRGREVRTLDIDDRFEHLHGFLRWDLDRPEHLGERFDVILCDPPFFNVSLSQLFTAIRMLSGFDFTQKIAVSYLTRRAEAVLGTFAPFNLRPTGVHPGYVTVQQCAKNDIEFYANFDLAGEIDAAA